MTAAFFNKSVYERKIIELFSNKAIAGAKEQFEKQFSEYSNDPLFQIASRFIRFNATKYDTFKKQLQASSTECNVAVSVDDLLKGMPLIVPASDADKLRVYQSLVLDKVDTYILSRMCFCVHPNAIKTLYSKYKDEKNGIGWNTIKKIWGKVKKHDDIETARVLTRYTNLAKHGVTDAQIRNIAAGIDEYRKPLKLVYADKPADMIEMYASGPHSCMSNDKAREQNWKEVLFDNGHHPTSFFAYHPYVRGVYAKMKGVVIARTFIYQNDDGKWQYGRLYFTNEKMKERFEEALRQEGYTFMGHHETHKFKRKATFEIPGIKCGSSYVMPLPYCDNLHNSIEAVFDKKHNKFMISCGGTKANIAYQGAQGFVYAIHLENGALCHQCGRNVNQHHRPIETLDGHWFCHPDHAVHSGYVDALRSDGVLVWVMATEAVTDYVTGQRYTNAGAAKAHGAFPMIGEHEEWEDDGETVSATGPIIEINGENFSFTDGSQPPLEWVKSGACVETNRDINGRRIYKMKKTERPILPITIKTQKVVELTDDDRLVA